MDNHPLGNLPDAAFAVVEKGADTILRHFPHHNGDVQDGTEHTSVDLDFLRASLSKLADSGLSEELKLQAGKHLIEHARALIEPVTVSKVYTVNIIKTMAPQRIVIGPVLVPDDVDQQGHIYSAEEVEKASHQFVMNYGRSTRMGLRHKDMTRPIHMVQSWIADKGDLINGRIIKKGTWLMAAYVEDDDAWEAVEKGILTGFSIHGRAKAIPIS